jgi:hypothetical protein
VGRWRYMVKGNHDGGVAWLFQDVKIHEQTCAIAIDIAYTGMLAAQARTRGTRPIPVETPGSWRVAGRQSAYMADVVGCVHLDLEAVRIIELEGFL